MEYNHLKSIHQGIIHHTHGERLESFNHVVDGDEDEEVNRNENKNGNKDVPSYFLTRVSIKTPFFSSRYTIIPVFHGFFFDENGRGMGMGM